MVFGRQDICPPPRRCYNTGVTARPALAPLPLRLGVFARGVGIGVAVGTAAGLSSALFLTLLGYVTDLRTADPRWVWALPLAGLAIGAFWQRWGEPIGGGADLILDTMHDDGPRLPLRMAPMVLVGSVLTHLFGGSAGREGTAVQMGASLADAFGHRFRFDRGELRRDVLAAGMAGGFGAVFGTPVAGAVFGLEVRTPGRLDLGPLVPALSASLIGDMVVRGLGIQHALYPNVAPLSLSLSLLGRWLLFAVVVAAVTAMFVAALHRFKGCMSRRFPHLPLRMAVGGLLVLALWRLLGDSRYLGLGVPTILAAFDDVALPVWAFAVKLVFTVVTLGSGFLGGEVTPLFFIGATLGHALAAPLGLPTAMAAAVGLAAVFGVAANTPLALVVMAGELVGIHVLPHALVVMTVAWLLVGHRGIYSAQRMWRDKAGRPLATATRLAR